MMRVQATMQALLRDSRGTMAIETAFVAPVLIIMALGGFETSIMVARQTELRSAAAETVALALTADPGEAVDVGTIEDIIEASTGLDDDQVTVTTMYRCDSDADLIEDFHDCGADAVISTFLQIDMTETYTPTWTEFGIGGPIDFDVERTVQVS